MALWDLARGTPRDLPVPDGCHPSSIACRTFAGTGGDTTGSTGGGRTLAVVGGTDGDVRELDLASGKTTELAPRMHSQRVAAAAVGFSGRLPVAATAGAEGAEGQVCLWDLATKQRIISRRLTSRVKSLALTTVTGAATLVATSDNGDIHILDMMLRVTAQLRIGIQSTAAYAVDCLQHDDTTIAVTGHSNAAYVWDLTDHELIGTLPVEGEVKAVACAKLPGRPIAVLMTGTSLSVWDLRHHGLLTTLRTRFIPPAGLAVFSGRDDHALTVVTLAENKLREHKFTLADPAAGQPREALAYEALAHETPRPASRLGEVVAGHASPVTAVSAGRAGSRHVMVTTDKGGHVIIWDLNTGSVLERLPHSFVFSMTGTIPPISAVSAVRGELAVVLGRGQRTRIWRSSARHQAIEGSVTALCCIDLRGRPTVVIGGKYRVARIVDVENWQEVGQISHRFKRVFDLDSRDDGHGSVTVFVAGQLGDGSAVRSFSIPQGRHEDELELPGESITRIRVTEIGHVPHLVTLNASGSIQVWDLSARQVVGGRLGGHTAKFNAMAVGSVEGLPVVVTGARDRHVRMWSLATREEIQDIRMPGPVQAVEMGRRGDIIAAFGTEIACLRRVRT
jgi:WD40 repeat protein